MTKAPAMNTAILAKQEMLLQNKHIREGRKTIIANRDLYFSKLDQQSTDQFQAMVSMAPVYILYPKIVDGFVGTVFAKDPILTGVKPEDIDVIANVDLLGNNMAKLSEKIVKDVFENGFCASYNDYSDTAGQPFIQFIPSSNFISFRVSEVEGHPSITQFIYTEDIEEDDPDDEFSSIIKTYYTVLDLADNDSGSYYRIRVFKESDEADGVDLVSSEFPKMDGKPFDRIPMQIHGVDANNYTVKKSPLQDLSDMNISVMQRVVDQVYMLHWTALPTPWITGVDDDDEATTIGPSKAWRLSSSESKVGMLEFSGNSARAHQDYIDNLKEIMASTGAQILKKEGVSRETATSVLVRSAAQTSLVATLVNNLSIQLETILKTHLEWSKITAEGYSYQLNDDFIKVDMEPNAQIALVKSWLDGAISHKSLFSKLKEGELIDANQTFEQELLDIDEFKPPFFSKQVDAEIAEEAAEEAAKVAAVTAKVEQDSINADQKNDLSGSNIENENVKNKQASEQA